MDKPIRERVKGTPDFEWRLNGVLHREDGPAVESSLHQCWYLHGKRHRIGGPAVTIPYGAQMWYVNGQLHREDGPAIDCANGNKMWFIYDRRHRLDGPAVITEDVQQWFIDGVELTENEFNDQTNHTQSKST